MRQIAPSDAVTAAPLSLAASWHGHNGRAPQATSSDSETCLLLGAGPTPGSDGRLIWRRNKPGASRTSVWEGSTRELRRHFERLRLSALLGGRYPHQAFLQHELIDAARIASISLVQRISFVDMTISELDLPEPRLAEPDQVVELSNERSVRRLRLAPSGQRVLLALSPMAGPQIALYGAPPLRGGALLGLVRHLEDFAERSSDRLQGVSVLDLLICEPPHRPLLLDLLSYESVDVRTRPWSERRALMSQLLNELPVDRGDLELLEPLAHDAAEQGAAVWVREDSAYHEPGWIARGKAA